MSDVTRERAVELAQAACLDAGGALLQATVDVQRSRYTRLGAGVVLHRGEIHQSRVILRAVVGGGEGVAYTNDLSAEGLVGARERALSSARSVPADPDHPGLPSSEEAGEPADVDPWDEATAAGDFAAETEDLEAALTSCRAHGADLAGIVEHCGRARAVVNSRGLVRSSRATHAGPVSLRPVGRAVAMEAPWWGEAMRCPWVSLETRPGAWPPPPRLP